MCIFYLRLAFLCSSILSWCVFRNALLKNTLGLFTCLLTAFDYAWYWRCPQFRKIRKIRFLNDKVLQWSSRFQISAIILSARQNVLIFCCSRTKISTRSESRNTSWELFYHPFLINFSIFIAEMIWFWDDVIKCRSKIPYSRRKSVVQRTELNHSFLWISCGCLYNSIKRTHMIQFYPKTCLQCNGYFSSDRAIWL